MSSAVGPSGVAHGQLGGRLLEEAQNLADHTMSETASDTLRM